MTRRTEAERIVCGRLAKLGWTERDLKTKRKGIWQTQTGQTIAQAVSFTELGIVGHLF